MKLMEEQDVIDEKPIKELFKGMLVSRKMKMKVKDEQKHAIKLKIDMKYKAHNSMIPSLQQYSK